MRYLRALLARVVGLFAGRRADDDVRDELQAHVEMETAENIRRGMAPDVARRAALLASGGLTQAVEAVHDQRGLPWVEGLASDAKYALRALRTSPVFTFVVVTTLALGIGANTAIFSVVRGVLLKPLPHKDGDRLVYLRQSADGAGRANLNFSVPEIRDLRAGVPSLGGGVAEYSPWNVVLQGDNDAIRINAGLVTGNYFEVMGLSPALGRFTQSTDDGPGVPPVMVLTYDFWRQHFGGDSSVINRQVRVDGTLATIIGVVQPAPFFPLRMDVLMNMVISAHHLSAAMEDNRTHRMTEVVARLTPGATLKQVKAEVAAEYGRLQAQYPDAYSTTAHQSVAVIPFKQAIGQNAQLTLWLLMSAAAFVMIIAAANVANLTLMRGVRREHELVVRASLGSGIGRLRRLLLVENLLLSGMGAALGALIALGGVPLLASLANRFSPRANEIRLDAAVFGFAFALAIGVALLFSFIAFLPSEGMLATAAGGGRRASSGLRRQRLQRALVVVQVAVSVVLLAGAGLLTRTMIRLANVNTGLRTEEVLSMEVDLITPNQLLAGSGAVAAAKERYAIMRSDVAALPGVVAVGLGSSAPLRASGLRFEFKRDGKVPAVGEAATTAEFRTASEDYFNAAGIPIVRGRAFETTDQPGSEKVVIVNQIFADRFFPGEDPIGKRIALAGMVLRYGPYTADWRTIVGVVGNTHDGGLDANPAPAFYMPWAQELSMSGGLVIRADSNVASLTRVATGIVRRLAPTTPIEHVMTVRQIKDESIAPRRLNAALISSFGVLAVIIAAVGIAGVLAFSVSTRTNEIGIRLSLGAGRGHVEWMILREGGVLVLGGLALGVSGAWLGAGLIRGFLFGVAPHDPTTFATVAAVMVVVGIVACWIPALRAARIDPAITMRA